MLFDTHAHLDFDAFDADRDAVVDRAIKAGISGIVNPGCDVTTSRSAIALAARYSGLVYAAVGIHPNNTAEARPGDAKEIARLASQDGVVAIGETGLDWYRDHAPRDVQINAFKGHLELALELDLPVIIHFREVEMDGVEAVGTDLLRRVHGVFHCFGGSADFAERLVSWGFYIGFDGPLTYRNSDRAEVAETVPFERCLIETDAPFLTPQSNRGRRNEPAFVAEVAGTLARVKGVSVDEAVEITGANARTLFGIDPAGGAP